VTYNEAERVRACLESVVETTTGLAVDIVLVDSNSTDSTVEIAAEFPITILQITDDSLTTPAAGRAVGTAVTSGEVILFVDGDMVLHPGWLERALDVLESDPNVAGVDGHLNAPAESDTVRSVDAVRGVALYRRSALEFVGGFDPFLQAVEDIHLGFELTGAGYRLLRLPEVAAEHPARASMTDPFRRWRRGYTIGTGQALRRSLESPRLVAKHLLRARHRIGLLAWAVAGLLTVVVPATFPAWVALTVVGLVGLGVTLGPRKALGFLLSKASGLLGLALGFARPIPDRDFPMDAVVLRRQGSALTQASAPDEDGATGSTQ
jgi:GT2 family glycosyltransferase